MSGDDWHYQLRPATEKDDQAIRGLVRSARINPTGLDWRRFVVAVDTRQQVIGCGQVKPHRDGSHELASLVVEPTWRGRGLGGALIRLLLRDHPGELYLMCRASLGGLYAKFGFQPVDLNEMPRYFRRVSRLASLVEPLMREGETLLVMKRDPGM